MKKAITRTLSIMLACLLALSMGIFSYAAEDATPGDVNADGVITIADVLMIARSVVNDTDLANSDANGDGRTTFLDVIHALKLAVRSEPSKPETGSAQVVVENGTVKEEVSISGTNTSATVPEGVAVDENTTELTLTVTELNSTNGNIAVGDTDEAVSYDVHIEGVAASNDVAIIVDLGAILDAGQNTGTVTLYHVENGEATAMTQVMTYDELDAHNEFYYEPATGKVYVALATFSEIALLSNTENVWDGTADHTWYKAGETNLVIANANQLWSFSQIVGGMAEGYAQDDFAGKTVTLAADINIGDLDSENGKVFYPIGYYNSAKSYTKVSGGSIASGVSSFEGTFDGAGHAVKNFYQNTWEMFGDYNSGYSGTPNHYKDAMGLFGYVYFGTVKNLTVENFSSDGEFTPTGVIAAYACNSTFKNIAIVNCNPRVYNTGNGGIVGIGGNDSDPDTYKLTFENITIDNTNKITALWGSWDVACGGLVGMFRGAGHAYMTNCHVAAQIDVYNDVCGNYQYYWYRYAGMLIGTNKTMVTDENGYTVPETSKYHATGCTVHFGDWNDYYYCELVANSLASYTHDHQFSRLDEVKAVNGTSITYLDGTTGTVPASGRYNYVVVEDGHEGTEYATCYHFVDGAVWEHEDAGFESFDLNGDTDLTDYKEDNRHIYLPFNQLFTGYGWGVKNIPIYDNKTEYFKGVAILDRETGDSVKKFNGTDRTYTDGMTVKASDLFSAIGGLETAIALQDANVTVAVSPVSGTATAKVVRPANASWEDIEITFSGTGSVTVTIQDYLFCSPTKVTVKIIDNENYHVHADGESDLVWIKDGNTYKLVCSEDHSLVYKTRTEAPVIYFDPMYGNSYDDPLYPETTSDYALGTAKTAAVATLPEAVSRLATTGGKIVFISPLSVHEHIENLPKWTEEITFTAKDPADANATVDTGLRIRTHGRAIGFQGPTKIENIVINGCLRRTENNSDKGYYNIPVFVANWNDLTVGDNITAFGACYFVVGNFFIQEKHIVADYLNKGLVENMTVVDGKPVTDLSTGTDASGNPIPKEVTVKFSRTTAKDIVYDAITDANGKEWPAINKPATATYDRLYLGTRNRTDDDMLVKNVNVNFESDNATFNMIFAGSVSGTRTVNEVEETVDTQMDNCGVTAIFNGTGDAYIKHFQVGSSNTHGSGSAYLDRLHVEFNGTAYMMYTYEPEIDGVTIKSDDDFTLDSKYINKDHATAKTRGFTTKNVRDLTVIVSPGSERTSTTRMEERLFFSASDGYLKSDNFLGTEKLHLEIGTHSFAYKDAACGTILFPIYNTNLYGTEANGRISGDETTECSYNVETATLDDVCTTCGHTRREVRQLRTDYNMDGAKITS